MLPVSTTSERVCRPAKLCMVGVPEALVRDESADRMGHVRSRGGLAGQLPGLHGISQSQSECSCSSTLNCFSERYGKIVPSAIRTREPTWTRFMRFRDAACSCPLRPDSSSVQGRPGSSIPRPRYKSFPAAYSPDRKSSCFPSNRGERSLAPGRPGTSRVLS